MSNETKMINITGQNNRYQMKKINRVNEGKPIKKTNVSTTWKFDKKYLKHSEQILLINELSNSIVEETIKRQINKKIYSYKQQDMKKTNYDDNSEKYKDFNDFDTIITAMNKCNLKCHYCRDEMLVLYENVRDGSQWTVDRINNNIGHIKSNFNLACLKCNLKRRNQDDKKYLFTSQLSINKIEI